MALFGKLETHVEISASASKFHEMFKSKPHHVTHATSSNIQGCELHEGDWGTVGSIIFWNYVLDGKPCAAKEIVEAIDEKKNSVTFKVIEGNLLDDYKTFVITIQVSPKEDGSIVHLILEYEKRHETIPDPHSLLQFAIEVSKDLDNYLINQA